MSKILIPDTIIKEIETLIQDDAIKRAFGHKSVRGYILFSIEQQINANKDTVGIPTD